MTEIAVTPVSVSRRAAAGAGWIIAWRMATRNLGLLSTLILVRLLQPSDFGLVALATGFISSVDALSAIGVQDALVRAPAIDRDLYDTGFGLCVLRGLLTAAVIAAIAWPVGDFFNDPRLGVVMLALSAGTVISAFENIGIVDFRRDLAFRKEFDMQFWSRVAGVATTVTTAAIWHSYWALVAGILVNRAARLVQSYLMSSYRPRLALRAWRRIIGFSLWTWAQTMLYQARERIDSIVVGRFMGATPVGVFSVGFELGFLPVSEIVEPLGRALFSGFASLHNARQGLQDIFLDSIGLGFLLILPAGFGISMIADPMVRLTLGAQWIGAVPVVQILSITAFSAIFTATCATLLNAIGRPGMTFYISIASTIVRIALLLILVPPFGLSGAAAAVSVCVAVDLAAFLGLTLPGIGVTPSRLFACVVRPMIATAAMVIGLWSLNMAWTPGSAADAGSLVLDAGSRAAIGSALYVIVLGLTWVIAGRPEGAEHHALAAIGKVWTKCLRWL
jgi:O-antigen/teichoic acid export membrane protein